MEENVSLDSKKQKKFDKSIKGIKKLLKKDADKPHKPAVLAPKDAESEGAKGKKKRKEKGLVYLSHIPHGFYEHEMTQYFKQFGTVTNVRVIRSPQTGRSKGYAFVEFREPEVAEIVAETMNNYLMGKRLIKAAIIPPEKQRRRALRKHWSSKHNPTADRRVKERKSYNADTTDKEHLKRAKKMLSTVQKTKKKLSDLGIDYDFFTPVDVPEPLLQQTEIKLESDKKANVKNEPKEKKKKNKKAVEVIEKVADVKKAEIESKPNNAKNKKEAKKAEESDKVKQNKTKDASIKLPENFIEVGEASEESDSSFDFDSDEYEKMMENDSDASSGDESEDEDDASDDDDDENEDGSDDLSEEEIPKLIPIKEKKGKKPIVASPLQPKLTKPANVPKVQKVPPPQAKKAPKPVNVPKRPLPAPQVMKRKHIQSEESPKKPKFEKKDNKPRNKQFKKKNKA